MKLLIVTNAYPSPVKPYAGVFVVNQYTHLRSKYTDIYTEIFYLRRSFSGPIGGFFKYGKAFLRFLPLLRHRYDIIHLHFFFPMVWFISFYRIFRPETKVVVTLHGSDVLGHFQSSFSRRVHSHLAKRLDAVISVGPALADEFEARLGRSVDKILPAGIDEKIFRPREASEIKYDLIFVGTFDERKGFDLLIAALEEIQERLRVCVVGSGILQRLLDKVREKHDIDLYLNLSQIDIAALMCKSKFLVLPSRREPFGLVVSEAMFCGVPAIVSDADGLSMQVVDGKNGFVITADVASLTKCIRNAMDLPTSDYTRMRNAALRSNKQYGLTRICDQLVSLYRSLLG